MVLSTVLWRVMFISVALKRTMGWILAKNTVHNTRCVLRTASPIRLFSATTDAASTDSKQVIYKELESLAQEIRTHDNLYYNQAKPQLTDDEYDALVEREANLCRQHPDVLEEYQLKSGLGIQATRFGGRVGAVVATATNKRLHLPNQPMLSLDNIHTRDELIQWLTRIQRKLLKESDNAGDNLLKLEILTEPKLDGLSLSLRYEQSTKKQDCRYQLKWAATRGDGKKGQDVTAAICDMGSIPTSFTIAPSNVPGLPSIMEIRGEVVLPSSIFQQIKSKLNKADNSTSFSNARNAASGILLRKSANETLRRDLQFYAYDVVVDNDDGFLASGLEMTSWLKGLGFDTPNPMQRTELELRDPASEGDNETDWDLMAPMLDYHQALLEYRRPEETGGGKKSSTMKQTRYDWPDCEMDGAVHKINSFERRKILGSSNRSPRWAIAHKFPSQTVLTELLSIEVQVGRTGALTPVAYLRPTDIDGVIIQRATLHNFGHLQSILGTKKVPVGAQVLVRRAGEVIPQVVKMVDMDKSTPTKDWISLEAPSKCPACQSKVIVDEVTNTNNGTVGQVLRCGGPPLLCPPRAVNALAHSFSRDALDITGLSEARIDQLMDVGLLKMPSDLFQLVLEDENAEEGMLKTIAELPGWGPKSVKNLHDVIKQRVDDGITLGRFIFSLGIRFAGQHSSNLLASVYGDVDSFLDDVESAADQNETEAFTVLRDETEATKGIGPVLVNSLMAFAKEQEMVQAARDLAKAVPVQSVEKATSDEDKPWKGWSVVFTGSLPGMSRTEAQKIAKDLLGAKSAPGSVSKSTSLVVFGEKGGKKLDNARELGVALMEADEFIKLVEDYRSKH